MPGETPDYQSLNAQAVHYPVTDLGELAGRLGALQSIDRRGDVVYIDSFESGLGSWLTFNIGANSDVYLSLAQVKSGMLSVALVGGDDAGGYAQIFRRTPLPPATLYGIEVWVQVSVAFDHLDLSIDRYTGAQHAAYTLRFDDVNNRLQHLNGGGTYTTIATGLELLGPGGLWHAFKLVIDPENDAYVRAVLDNDEYDLADVAASTGASATAEHLEIALYCYAKAAGGGAVYVDDVIITHNEPA